MAPSLGTPEPQSQTVVAAVLVAASQHLGIPSSQLTPSRVEPRNWPDASLGCPKPGLLYAQVITPGYLVEVSGQSRTLEYHTNAQGTSVVLCKET